MPSQGTLRPQWLALDSGCGESGQGGQLSAGVGEALLLPDLPRVSQALLLYFIEGRSVICQNLNLKKLWAVG